MAKIKVLDQAVVLTTDLTNTELKKAEKYFPDSLILKEKDEYSGKNVPVFGIATTKAPEGTITNFGIEFPEGDPNDKASVTILIEKMGKKAKIEYVKDNFGKVLQNLIKIEQGYATSKAKFDKEYEELDKSISID